MKKIHFGGKPPRPEPGPGLASSDEWVADRVITIEPPAGLPVEKTKRLTIDVSLALHKRIKSRCAMEGLNMADVMRELLENRFPEEYEGKGEGATPGPD